MAALSLLFGPPDLPLQLLLSLLIKYAQGELGSKGREVKAGDGHNFSSFAFFGGWFRILLRSYLTPLHKAAAALCFRSFNAIFQRCYPYYFAIIRTNSA